MDDVLGEVITSPIRFDIFTRRWNPEAEEFEPDGLTASIGSTDQKMRLHGTASSTIRDLHGDTMLLSALEDMERAANNGLTIFGNHSYNVPEDVYGTVERARLKQAGTVDKDGNPIYDLAFDVVINDENERAVKTWRAIDKKSKLGMSIGAMIPPGGAVRDKKSGALTISHVDLMETSIVGIPANPRSWIENAVKAFTKSTTTMPLGSPQLTLDTDAGTYRVEGSLSDLAPGSLISLSSTDAGGEEVIVDIGMTAEIDVQDAATCPDCGKAKGAGGCDNAFHSKDVEPDVTEAKITVIEVDTGDSGSSQQDAPQSEPSSEETSSDETVAEEAPTPADVVASAEDIIDSSASLEPDVVTIFRQLIDTNKLLVRELEQTKVSEREAIAARVAAEAARDTVATMAIQVVSGTKAILDKLADQPVGRRAVFHEAELEFSQLEGIYSRDFLNLLRSNA